MSKLIDEELVANAMSYADYRSLLEDLLKQGKTTGLDQSEAMIGYGRLNLRRMNKWERIGQLIPELKTKIQEISQPTIWLVLTEGWCGDAAQCLPFIYMMAETNGHIKLKLVLRDQHPHLMDAFLTDGGRSIPKLIVLNNDLQVLGTWGPRPKPMQDLMLENKRSQAMTYQELSESMHLWYAKDRGITLQQEFLVAVDRWFEPAASI